MRVHPGHAGLFQASVTFSVQKVPGMANRYMGSDGHHFAVLTGPGRIWLQSMPLPILAGVIGEYMPDRDDHGTTWRRGAAGGVLGGMIRVKTRSTATVPPRVGVVAAVRPPESVRQVDSAACS